MWWLLFAVMLYNVFADTQCPIINIPEDRRIDASKYRFVQFNVEWLFLDYYLSSDCPGNGCPWKNNSEAQTHLEYIANVINELQPDTVNLCEVEGCDELSELITITSIDYKPYLIKGTDTSTGQNVGLITKIDPIVSLYRTEDRVSYPISKSTCNYTGSPGTTGVSKHLITELLIKNTNIAIIGTHFLAYPTDKQRCAERETQAQVIQKVIYNYIQRGYEVIISGDLNDFDGEILDANNNKPISSVLNILKGISGNYQYDMQSVGNKMQQDSRFSDWYDKNGNCQSTSSEFSQIDHILVTPNLYDHIVNVFMYHGYKEYCGTYDSDHYPLVVDFVF